MVSPLNLRVVVADDDENDRFLLQRAFIRLRLNPPLAVLCEGEQVIEYLAGYDEYSDRVAWPFPDLLIVDHWMPRLSGIDVISWIRSETRFSRLAVLLLSGGLSPRQAGEMAKLHAAYGVKPTDSDGLAAVLTQGIEAALAFTRAENQEGTASPTSRNATVNGATSYSAT
jgi:CheY-like chemotaxis protein